MKIESVELSNIAVRQSQYPETSNGKKLRLPTPKKIIFSVMDQALCITKPHPFIALLFFFRL